MKMSWAPQVIADSSGKWTGNGLRFATKEEAEANVRDLAARWFLVRETRVVGSIDPVNYRYANGTLIQVKPSEECPGHVASEADPKICGRCGVHINELAST
jgi:hypothetical protein